jgi:hypothetical protein
MYLEKLREQYFLNHSTFFLFPAAINHLLGSITSSSPFLKTYAEVSFLLQGLLIFPASFMLSQKLKKPQVLPPIRKGQE